MCSLALGARRGGGGVTCLAAEARPSGRTTLKAAGTADLAVRVRAPRRGATDLVARRLVKVRVLSARAAMLKAEATRRDRVKRELTQLVAAATYLRRALFALAAANRVAGALVAPPVPPPPSAARADPWPDSDGGDGDDSDDGGDGDDEDDATGEGGVGQSLARALAAAVATRRARSSARTRRRVEYRAWSPRNCWGATASQLTPALRGSSPSRPSRRAARRRRSRPLRRRAVGADARRLGVDDVAPLPGNVGVGRRLARRYGARRAPALLRRDRGELAAGGGASAPASPSWTAPAGSQKIAAPPPAPTTVGAHAGDCTRARRQRGDDGAGRAAAHVLLGLSGARLPGVFAKSSLVGCRGEARLAG